MASVQDIVRYCDEYLDVSRFNDYCPNGLQVEGDSEVARIVTAVTASEQVIDEAIALGAQVLLVHHGYFWRNESPRVVGPKKRRLQKLLAHNINLVAYHLPLDAHPEVGNNAQLAARLGIKVSGSFSAGGAGMGMVGEISPSVLGEDWSDHIKSRLGRTPLYIAAHARPLSRIAWCTGGAQHYIDTAAELGVDAYLSGEASEQTYHMSKELGISYFGAGHHATERYGVIALGNHLASQFGVSSEFIEISNPV